MKKEIIKQLYSAFEQASLDSKKCDFVTCNFFLHENLEVSEKVLIFAHRNDNTTRMMETRTYKSRTREEVMAWLQRARERKDAFQKRANEIFAEEERLRQQAADSHYYDIVVK